jgi:hypothetical protein
MRRVTAQEILAVWERARGLHPVDQALVLLSAADPDARRDDLAGLSTGRRDRLLFSLRDAWFGDSLEAGTRCPRCREELEMRLLCSDMTMGRKQGNVSAFEMWAMGYLIIVRTPNSFDLAAISDTLSVQEARSALFRRCVVSATRDGEPVAVEVLPESLIAEVSGALAEADPGAEVILDLNCPACGHSWQGLLDIGYVLWAEVDARARRLLYEVHRLAVSYGWSETDILALSPARRQLYLEMLSS